MSKKGGTGRGKRNEEAGGGQVSGGNKRTPLLTEELARLAREEDLRGHLLNKEFQDGSARKPRAK